MKIQLKKVFAKLNLKLQKLFSIVTANSEKAVKLVQKIKEIVESPVTGAVVKATPFLWDDIGLDFAKKYLPKALEQITIAHGIVIAAKDEQEFVEKVMEYIKELTPNARKYWYVNIAAEVTYMAADGKLEFHEAVRLSQKIFAIIYRKEDEETPLAQAA